MLRSTATAARHRRRVDVSTRRAVAARRASPPAPAPAPERRPGRLPWIALWLAAFIVRCVYVLELDGSPLSRLLLGDARAYDTWARALAGGDWLGHEVFYQAPLYPYFLGVLYRLGGTDLLAVRVAQAALGATACLFLARAGAALFTPAVGLLAGALLALNPSAVYFDGLVQKTVLDGFFFTLLLLAVARLVAAGGRRRDWLLAGVALGFLSLTRENALGLVALVLAWGWLQFRDRTAGARARAAAVFLAGVALVLAPVALRNLAVGGELHLTTSQLGANLYIGNNPDADGTYRPLRWGRGNALFERQDATELAEQARGRPLTPAEVSAYWTGRVVDFVREQPLAWLRLMLRKWLLVWNAIELGDTEDQYTHADWSVLLRVLTAVLHFGVVLPLAAVGVVLTWPARRRLAILYLLLLGYAATVSVFFVFGRYRFPLVPILLLFAAAGVLHARALLRAGRARALAPAAVAAVCAALVANWPLVTRDEVTAITYYNLGGNAAEAHDDARAMQFLRTAVTRRPGFAQAHQQLGAALFRQGDVAAAAAEFGTAVRLNPGYTDARHNLASALFRLGQLERAITEARATLALDPTLHATRALLGRALLFAGRPAEAVTELEPVVAAEPNDAAARHDLAMALGDAGRVEEAIPHYRVVVRALPESADAHYNFGNALASLGRLEEARAELETAVRLRPESVLAHLNLGQVLAAQGDPAAAAVHLQTALRLAPPGSPEAAKAQALIGEHAAP